MDNYAPRWKVSGQFNKKEVDLHLLNKPDVKIVPINYKGWNCPCFLVKDVKKLWDKLRNNSDVCLSEINPLSVNSKLLNIGFMSICGVEIVLEFISPCKDITN